MEKSLDGRLDGAQPSSRACCSQLPLYTTHQSRLLLVVAVVDELPDETRSTLDESWMETLDGNLG